MQTPEELKQFTHSLIKKYHNQSVNPKQLNDELVQYAKLGITYTIISDHTWGRVKKILSNVENMQFKSLADALIYCLDKNPYTIGAYVTGSHVNSELATLNKAVIKVIDDTATVLEILEEHPKLIGDLGIHEE